MQISTGGGTSGPRITIGLPVRNGENFIEHAIDSILAQTFTDFRLIISDNASTDRTNDICMAYAARDRRVVVHRHAENIGAAQNFNWVFAQNSSPYFKWAAHDDVLGPNFLRVCVDRLDADPTLAICHTLTVKLDGQGLVSGTYDHEIPLAGRRPRHRFYRLLWVNHFTEIWGVMRSEYLVRTRLYRSFVGSDRSLMAELLLMGGIHYIPEYHFFRRDHDDCYCRSKLSAAERLVWFDPKKKSPILNDAPAKLMAYLHALWGHRVPNTDRLACMVALAGWCGQRSLRRAGLWPSRHDPAARHALRAPAGAPPQPPRAPRPLRVHQNVPAGSASGAPV